MEFRPDKSKLVDTKGRPLTQSLFLEIAYNPEVAVYSTKEYDFEYEGKIFPSLKRLYLQMEDVIEYDFATTYLSSWKHWQRICNNKLFSEMIGEWREELELKLRSQAVKDIIDMTADEKSFQAAKWLADKGWDKRPAGRPSKEAVTRELKTQAKLQDQYGADVERLFRK